MQSDILSGRTAMAGRPALFGKAMTTAERQRRRSDRLQYGEEHVGQLYRAGKAAFAFAQALEDVARTYARLEAEHGGDKQFSRWLKENSWAELDDGERRALIALGRARPGFELGELPDVPGSPLSIAAIWRWAVERQERTKPKMKK
jgi:hypothetical protein